MKSAMKFTAAAVFLLLPVGADAATALAVKDLPNGNQVTLQGTVEDFNSQHSFMLRDNSGSVKIDLSSTHAVVLKEGEQVTVSGTVNQTILGPDVIAASVSEDKGIGQKVGEAIDSVTGQDAAGSARTSTIASLPKSGLVSVNGVVQSVYSGKSFAMKDPTGVIDVAIKSGESASLNKGTEVTVIGNVDDGFFSKSINATEVKIRANSAPMAEQ